MPLCGLQFEFQAKRIMILRQANLEANKLSKDLAGIKEEQS
jgi:hypothetical protein